MAILSHHIDTSKINKIKEAKEKDGAFTSKVSGYLEADDGKINLSHLKSNDKIDLLIAKLEHKPKPLYRPQPNLKIDSRPWYHRLLSRLPWHRPYHHHHVHNPKKQSLFWEKVRNFLKDFLKDHQPQPGRYVR